MRTAGHNELKLSAKEKSMLIESHSIGDIFVRRFKADTPRYALLISHGIGAHSGIYNKFGAYQAARGVDVWAYDAPGHGLSTNTRPRGQFQFAEWVDACTAVASEIKRQTGVPVIAVGSSLGVAATFSSLHCDAIDAAVLMGSAVVPCSPGLPEKSPFRTPEVAMIAKMLGRTLRFDIMSFVDFEKDYGFAGARDQRTWDGLNLDNYEFGSFLSLVTHDPVIRPEENTKPILYVYGADDGMTPLDTVRATAAAIAGPVRFEIIPGGKHQLMLFNTEVFSDLVEEWASPLIADLSKGQKS
jgi:alpha-beta hydrolase superfamily lysophospholipase